MNKQRICVLLVGLAFLSYGVYTKEYTRVMRKAITICLECIGIGQATCSSMALHSFIYCQSSWLFTRSHLSWAFEKRMRQENKYMDVDLSYRKSIVHQAGLFSQAMMAENADIYKPLRVRQKVKVMCYGYWRV